MSTCQCSMAISMAGDGCRYCQPQTYIEHLLETLEDARAAPVSEAKAQGVIDFVFSGELPNATFVEVEDGNGNSINVGEWFKRDDGYSVLRLNAAPAQRATKAEISLAGCRCVRYGEGNPHWPCPLHSAPAQQVSVPDGWRVERGYSPSGYVLHSPSGSMVRVCDSGGGGIETAFALFLKAMLAAALSSGKEKQDEYN